MGYREDCYGRGLALHGDKTTTGASCISSLGVNTSNFMLGIVRVGDVTTTCPKCNQRGRIVSGEGKALYGGIPAAVDRSLVKCGCPDGTNKIIAPADQWIGSGPSPEQLAQEKKAAILLVQKAEKKAEEQRLAGERDRNRVFAKSCLRGEGCNDAGEQREPHTNFTSMVFYQAVPATDPASDTDVPQHAQTAKKKKPAEDIPEPKKRSALYKWWNGNHEEMDYQAAKATAASAASAQVATAGASVLGLVDGSAITSGTWAVSSAARLGAIAASGPGAPIAALLVGMMPGKLNDGEQDFIDRMRLEQMREAPSRVRYTWENDSNGDPVPRGWHTPPGKDMVRVRKMAWDNSRNAYMFTTEEEKPITIIWTPDHSGVTVPSNTGNQARPVLPSSVIVDPLPESTGITTTTSPTPEEKSFADYILILPMPNIPPIYIYLSKPPVKLLDVDLYSNFAGRPRNGTHADHMPSAAAVRAKLRRMYPDAKAGEIDALAKDVAAIVIPADVHQKLSATYGGRNTPEQIEQDSRDLRAALERDFKTISPELKARGVTEMELNEAKTKMNQLNQEQGLYNNDGQY